MRINTALPLIGIVALQAASSAIGWAQPVFELASVKPAPPAAPAVPGTMNSASVDRVRARFNRMTIAALVAFAYRVRPFQVSGPGWTNTSSFSIDATLPKGASADEAPEMLCALLQERFKLAVHRETRKFQVYALTVRKDGPKMMPAVLGLPKLMNGAYVMTLEAYATFVSDAADRPVVDQTGLEGEYLFPINPVRMEAYKRRTEQARANRPTAEEFPAEASEPSGLPLYSIVKQIGLGLVSRKILMPLLVIDNVERKPTEN